MRPRYHKRCVAGFLAVLSVTAFSTHAVAQNRGSSPFKLYLQTTGDWSGSYSGSELGLDNNTRILYSHNAGRLSDDGPEYVNMDAHLAALRAGIERYVPPDFDGLAILDYEGYPLSLYNQTYAQFRETRIAAVLREHPSLSHPEALARAEENYQPFVRRFFLDSLDLARQLRPDAQWGYYSLVAADRNQPADDQTRRLNDRSTWLWDRVDAICPYSYTGYYELDPEHERIESLMRDKTNEAVRLSRDVETRTGRRPIVLPYISIRTVYWGLSDYEGTWATSNQVKNFLTSAVDGGGDGVVLWQSVKNTDPRRRTESQYIEALTTTLAGVLEELHLGAFAESGISNRERNAYRHLTHADANRIIDRVKDRVSPNPPTLPELRTQVARLIVRHTEDRSDEVRKRVITSARRVERELRQNNEPDPDPDEGSGETGNGSD